MSSHANWEADAIASRRWLDTEGAEGETVQWIDEDLSGRGLSDVVLVESTLFNSNFSDCIMERADLSRAMAGGARFTRARLVDARFIKSQLTGAHFDCADAVGARFTKATMNRATFSAATLRGAAFDRANCMRTSFRGADLQDANLTRTNLRGADLSGADLSGACFDGTSVDAATALDGCVGLDRAVVVSILVAQRQLQGTGARAWLTAHAARRRWSVQDFELWALAKMSGPQVAAAAARLGSSEADLRRIATELDAVFDHPGHAEAEYRRILGEPTTSTPADASGVFAGSFRHEYHLPLWPDVVFVVNEAPNGTAWGFGFEGGPTSLPASLDQITPWRWTAARLRREAIDVEVHEEWSYDLDATFSFSTPAGPRRFRARFDLGLLQRWEESRSD